MGEKVGRNVGLVVGAIVGEVEGAFVGDEEKFEGDGDDEVAGALVLISPEIMIARSRDCSAYVE